MKSSQCDFFNLSFFVIGRKTFLWEGNQYDVMILVTFLYSECSGNKEIKSSLQDATYENIPIMMVGNKADLRQAVTEQGEKCVPINYGEKLAMVRSKCYLFSIKWS